MKKFCLILVCFVWVISAFREENNFDPLNRLFNGDMMLTPAQKHRVLNGGDIFGSSHHHGYAAMSNVSILWLPNNKTVPYNIVPELEKNPEATYGIMLAFREWEERTCLKFKRRTDEKDYIEFFKEGGERHNYGCHLREKELFKTLTSKFRCWSYVGRQGGRQNISLGDGCYGIGTVVHEIGHAMGFGHEQNRPDRDEYITVRWENVPQRKRHNFEKYSNKKVDSLNSTYDYKSFMQYSKTAFGANDSVTLDPKKHDIFQLGQRLGFTERDQDQAMKLYRCNGQTTRKADEPQTYTPVGRRYISKCQENICDGCIFSKAATCCFTKNTLHRGCDDVCDFENGLCHYTQDQNDDFDWKRRYGGTPSDLTGPKTDHTTGRMGTYIYTEASSPRKSGDITRLVSKVFPQTSKAQCLTFFLHMYSQNKTMMGNFHVYLKEGNTSTEIVDKHGSQSNGWVQVSVEYQPTQSYQLIFEGIRGSGYQGDISLDDISIINGKCPIAVPTDKKLEKDTCEDVNDRERQYCKQWMKGGYCETHKNDMKKYCRKTCNLCN